MLEAKKQMLEAKLLEVFNLSQLQSFKAFLATCSGGGVKDIATVLQVVDEFIAAEIADVEKQVIANRLAYTTCPSCGKESFEVITMDEDPSVVITECFECWYSEMTK